MLKKFESYWRVIHDTLAIASVLDRRYKMNFLECYFYKLYGIDCGLKLSRIFKYAMIWFSNINKKNETSYGSTLLEVGKDVDDVSEFLDWIIT